MFYKELTTIDFLTYFTGLSSGLLGFSNLLLLSSFMLTSPFLSLDKNCFLLQATDNVVIVLLVKYEVGLFYFWIPFKSAVRLTG